jgi:hypothetical protein
MSMHDGGHGAHDASAYSRAGSRLFSNRCLMLVLVVLCMGAGLFYAHEVCPTVLRLVHSACVLAEDAMLRNAGF